MYFEFEGGDCAVGWGTRYKSIPDGAISIFDLHNTSGRGMAIGSTQPLTEIITRFISWG